MSLSQLTRPHQAVALPRQTPTPCYDITKSYEQNRDEGPFIRQPYPKRAWTPPRDWTTLFDLPVASPIGIPAGPLLDSKWVTSAAQLGFDILTYKTIRSCSFAAHPVPNIVFVQPSTEEALAIQQSQCPDRLENIAITNSYGNPSSGPEVLQHDIAKARAHLKRGQIFIVSVFGTGERLKDLAQDYVRTAVLAMEAGAQCIEVNLSCPNLSKGEGSLYADGEASCMIVQQVVHAVSPLPVIVKTGVFPSDSQLQRAIRDWAHAGAQGLCGINTIPMKVQTPDGQPALGRDRLIAGVCGNPIRDAALHFTRIARETIDNEHLELTLLSCGGITLPEHFDAFLDAGCDGALSATGMMWDPYLALRWHEKQQDRRK